MTARDVMTPDPVTVTAETAIRRAAAVMQERSLSLLPVVDSATNLRLCGVITDRDIVDRCVAARHGGDCLVRDHWTSAGIETVHGDESLETIITKLATGNVRRAPVVDDENRVIGIVTRADLVRRGCRGDPALRARLVEQLSVV